MNSACPHKLLQDANWQWQADLQLKLEHNQRGTRLIRNRHQGPLYVQKPFYPEDKDCAHIYLLHPPGGLVSGDSLAIDIDLSQNAHTLITTPGAARVYKARQHIPTQQQRVNLRLENQAVMEWFPMEAIIYPGASAQLQTKVQLDEHSCFMGWEISCFGLPASDGLYDCGNFTQIYQIEKKGLPVFIDRFTFDGNNQALYAGQAGLRSNTVSGFFIVGPFPGKKQSILMEQLRAEIVSANMQAAISITWANHFYIARYLGDSAYSCRQGFVRLWRLLRPELIQRQACEPRIWLT